MDGWSIRIIQPNNVVPFTPPLIAPAIHIQHAADEAALAMSLHKGQAIAILGVKLFIF